jgi:hypothetical protein
MRFGNTVLLFNLPCRSSPFGFGPTKANIAHHPQVLAAILPSSSAVLQRGGCGWFGKAAVELGNSLRSSTRGCPESEILVRIADAEAPTQRSAPGEGIDARGLGSEKTAKEDVMTTAGVALVLRRQSHPQSGVATGPMARSTNAPRRATQLTTARTAVERSTTPRARLESQLLRRCSMIVPRTSPHAAPNFQHRSTLDRLLLLYM